MTLDAQAQVPVDAASPSELLVGAPASTDVPAAAIYPMLPAALRALDQDQGNALLQRYLARPADLWARWLQKIARLPSVLDYRRTPDTLLDHLRAHVGFGAGSGVPDAVAARLTPANLRKLVKLAVPYWRKRGRRDALQDAIRTLTGVTPWIMDWFFIRAMVDEVLLGVGGAGGDPVLVYHDVTAAPANVVDGEVQVAIRVPDEAGTLDRQLVQDLCALARPVGERYEVAFVQFLDTFLGGRLSHWQTLAGTPATVTAADTTTSPPTLAALRLPEGTAEGMITPLSATWASYLLSFAVGFADAGQTLRILVYMPGMATTDGLYVDLDPPGTIRVGVRQAGVDADVATVAADLTICTGLRGVIVDLQDAGGGNVLVRVTLDAVLVLDQTVAAPWAAGTAALQVSGATGQPVVVSGLELWTRPLDVRALVP
jgi:phage tail-like protein